MARLIDELLDDEVSRDRMGRVGPGSRQDVYCLGTIKPCRTCRR